MFVGLYRNQFVLIDSCLRLTVTYDNGTYSINHCKHWSQHTLQDEMEEDIHPNDDKETVSYSSSY